MTGVLTQPGHLFLEVLYGEGNYFAAFTIVSDFIISSLISQAKTF
jgi:hypothetical protein